MISTLQKHPLFLSLVITGVFIIVFICGAMTGSFVLDNYLHAPPDVETTKSEQIVERDGFVFALYGIEYQEIVEPLEEGYQYIIVDVSFENKTAEPVDVLPIFQLFLRDQSGQTYTIVPLTEINGINCWSTG